MNKVVEDFASTGIVLYGVKRLAPLQYNAIPSARCEIGAVAANMSKTPLNGVRCANVTRENAFCHINATEDEDEISDFCTSHSDVTNL